MNKKTYSIIIVNYFTADVLQQCIESIYIYEKPEDFEIIVIDNGSLDESPEIIETLPARFPDVKPILLKEQKSFAHANNTGFNSSTGQYVIIMNPDIIFTEPVLDKLKLNFEKNSIQPLPAPPPIRGRIGGGEYSALQENDNNIGVITPALTGTDGKFQRNYFQRYPGLLQFIFFQSIYAKFFFRFPSLLNKYLENQQIDASTGKMFYVEQIPFAFFMTKRDIYKSSGMIDEDYFLFFEDVDMSYKIAKKYKLAVDTSLKITHLGGSSFKNEENWNLHGLFIMSMVHFIEKHYSKSKSLTLKLLVLLNSLFILFIEKIKKLSDRQNSFRYKKHSYLLSLLFNKK